MLAARHGSVRSPGRVLLLLGLLAGCGPLAEERGHLATSPTLVYLPGAPEGAYATARVAIYNVGDAPLEVLGLELGISSGYSVESPPLPARLAPGAELDLRVSRYCAQGVAVENALEVVSDDPALPSLRVELRAPPAAALLTATPGAVEFGAVTSGGTATRKVLVRNLGLGVARSLGLEWAPGSSPDFGASLSEGELQPGATAPLELRYSPRGGGADQATLRLRWQGSPARTVELALSGHQDLKAPD